MEQHSGKLPTLPLNIRLDEKNVQGTNTLAYFGPKSFISRTAEGPFIVTIILILDFIAIASHSRIWASLIKLFYGTC